MKTAYITLYTGWGGLEQLDTSGVCIGKLARDEKWPFEIQVPLSAIKIEWDSNGIPVVIKVDLNN
ncbi:hypothetical protein [Oceanobacillus sp. J11TS1]|uniref:hypothetical protein n=1 Tax=Oceanobacillus sp. J11TS1 TaxID=2807191 RepID=UPI001B2E3C81|nr:hypothetical protein [Oceanobacillus sp. J11TS1]GIO21686.1 hypothetical protein J11TS1_02670 [Oceanobacillus sp. J11TS1]